MSETEKSPGLVELQLSEAQLGELTRKIAEADGKPISLMMKLEGADVKIRGGFATTSGDFHCMYGKQDEPLPVATAIERGPRAKQL